MTSPENFGPQFAPHRAGVDPLDLFNDETHHGVTDYYNKLAHYMARMTGRRPSQIHSPAQVYNLLNARLVSPKPEEVKMMRPQVGPHSCHENVAEAVRRGWTGDVYAGFYNNGDGHWGGHWWLAKGNQIYETTKSKRAHYFGVKLTPEEIQQHVKNYPNPFAEESND